MRRLRRRPLQARCSKWSTLTKGSDTETPLDFKMFSKLVMRAQHQIEGNNFDRRKTVLQYDEVLRRQRETDLPAAHRRAVLDVIERTDPRPA
ncbi:MAG: hypothetical protein MZU97_06925 [Bacillus subtilis]|nr:hypothetical protein [Bacillus subtilis]